MSATANGTPWAEVTRDAPCPACHRGDRCKVAPAGDRVMCFRTDSTEPAKGGGPPWYHKHPDAPPRDAGRGPDPRATFGPPVDFPALARRLAAALTPARRDQLAAALGLPRDALGAIPLLGSGADGEGAFWAFPEVDARGQMGGITRRYESGAKKQMARGRRGLTLPEGWAERAGPVYVCEGASDVLALTHAGLACVGRFNNAGGAALLAELFADLPTGREIVVLGENDEKPDGAWPGRDGAVAVAAKLRAALPGRDVRVALPPAGAKDARSWLTHPDRGDAPWPDRGAEFAATLVLVPVPCTPDPGADEAVPDDAAGTAPPTEERRWPAPLAAEAFHGPLGAYVRLVEADTEADPAAILIQLLVLFGNAVGRSAHVPVGPVRHFANEFAVGVGETAGGRKGTSLGDAKGAFAGVDDAWLADRVTTGLSSGEGLIHAVRDPAEGRQPVKEGGRVAGYETVVTDPGVADKRLVAVESEFVGVLKQADRLGNTLSVTVRQAWDSGDLRTLTKSAPTRATGAHVSIVGHITEAELKKYMGEVEMANGVGNRFLWFVSRRSKFLPEPPRPDPARTAAVRADILAGVEYARAAGAVSRDAGARAAWAEVYPHLERDRPGLSGALLARAAPHVNRLALIYALADRSPAVTRAHLLAALAVWDYCEASVVYLFGDATGDAVADDALRVVRGCPGGIARADLMAYFGRNIPSARLTAALGTLLAAGKVRRGERADTGGRPAEMWYPAGGAS